MIGLLGRVERRWLSGSAPLDAGVIVVEAPLGSVGMRGIVKDDMILRRYTASVNVQNQVYCGRMKFANTKVDTSPTAMIPFRDFLPILKFGIKNVDGTTKYMEPLEIVVAKVE